MMDERKTVPPVWIIWNETRGQFWSMAHYTKASAEHSLNESCIRRPDESFRVVKLVETALEDGGDVS